MKYEKMPAISELEIEKGLEFASKQVLTNLAEFTYKFQNSYSVKQFYTPIDNVEWTNGFWTGEIWLAYEYCGDERLKEVALLQVDNFYKRIVNQINVEHHDMGFLYIPSCVVAYKLTGSLKGREAAILAANQLVNRFQPKGEFIQAWGSMDSQENYRLIIDCLLNVPLLYWAYEETKEKRYREIADKHIYTTMSTVIRPDYSTWHTYYFDRKTGVPDHGATSQGYRDASAWARGQAWGIYGSALAYKYTKRKEYLEIFHNVTRYFLEHLPEDMISFWDLGFTDGDDQPRDSSAMVIAVCGMLEMTKYLSGAEREKYRERSCQIMKSLYDNYAVKDSKSSNGLLLHGTYAKQSPYNSCVERGVDECNSWGGYFYMEALTRLKTNWKLYW